ncbi:MAG: pantetheine-phosphate adenylyltransferase [Clostridia bacterium]
MKSAVYPGSFDPFTTGHLDVLKHAYGLFDTVYIGVLHNRSKNCVFPSDERRAMIEQVLHAEGLTNVRVCTFDGLLVDFMKQVDASYIIRGLRTTGDYLYEAEIASVNKHLMPEAQTVYFAADPRLAFISSGIVREIASFGGDIDGLVPAPIRKIIAERLIKR